MKEKLIEDIEDIIANSTTLKASERELLRVMVEYIKALEVD